MKDLRQVEKNMTASFSYVKKDILMLNDAFSDLHDKLQNLVSCYSNLVDEFTEIKKHLPKKKVVKAKVVKKTKKTAKKYKK